MAGYYDGMLGFLRHSVRDGFMGEWQMDLIRTGESADDLLQALRDDAPHHAKDDRLAENI